jgi:hypothetical protein
MYRYLEYERAVILKKKNLVIIDVLNILRIMILQDGTRVIIALLVVI